VDLLGDIDYTVDRNEGKPENNSAPGGSSVVVHRTPPTVTTASYTATSPSNSQGSSTGSTATVALNHTSTAAPPQPTTASNPSILQQQSVNPPSHPPAPPVAPATPLASNQPVPALQIEEYLATKMKLAQIMRDFNDKKLCFIGTDNSRILVQQYQAISSKVKAGEDISSFLRGRLVMFVTAVDKKKRAITETKLFIPDSEPLGRS
jgi:hypothetical protein